MRECDVCVILEDNHALVPTRYCNMCGHYMCHGCRNSPYRRTLAALKLKLFPATRLKLSPRN